MGTRHRQAVLIRTAWVRPAPVCFLLGLLGVLPMLVLTPPFKCRMNRSISIAPIS
jgi:hypothetical protein